MHGFFMTAWDGMRNYWQHIAVTSAICVGLEMVASHEKVSTSSRVRGAFFWFVYVAITVVSLTAFGAMWSKLHVKPFVTIDVGLLSQSKYSALHVLSWIVAPIAAGIIGEFFYYWFHRAQHTFTWMWRFHAVHHSLREMNGLNDNHHFTEEIFRIPFCTIPMSLFLNVTTGPIPAAIAFIFSIQGQFEHSCTKFNLGWFRYVIADNRFHRIHHTINKGDWGHNFGSLVPFWDIVFRTAKFPKKNEWPDVGIPGVDEPKTIRQFVMMPFTRKRLDGSDPSETPFLMRDSRDMAATASMD